MEEEEEEGNEEEEADEEDGAAVGRAEVVEVGRLAVLVEALPVANADVLVEEKLLLFAPGLLVEAVSVSANILPKVNLRLLWSVVSDKKSNNLSRNAACLSYNLPAANIIACALAISRNICCSTRAAYKYK